MIDYIYLQVVQSIEDCDNLTMKNVVLPFAEKIKIIDLKYLKVTLETRFSEPRFNE